MLLSLCKDFFLNWVFLNWKYASTKKQWICCCHGRIQKNELPIFRSLCCKILRSYNLDCSTVKHFLLSRFQWTGQVNSALLPDRLYWWSLAYQTLIRGTQCAFPLISVPGYYSCSTVDPQSKFTSKSFWSEQLLAAMVNSRFCVSAGVLMLAGRCSLAS